MEAIFLVSRLLPARSDRGFLFIDRRMRFRRLLLEVAEGGGRLVLDVLAGTVPVGLPSLLFGSEPLRFLLAHRTSSPSHGTAATSSRTVAAMIADRRCQARPGG